MLGGIWIVVTGLLARSQLNTIRDEVSQLQLEIAKGDLTGARHTAESIAEHADTAHTLTTGPAWAVAANLPGGAPLRTVRAIADSIDRLGGDALPGLVQASTELDPATLLGPNGRIDVTRITAAVPALDRAGAELGRATGEVAGQPASTWLGAVDSARRSLLGEMTSLGKTLRSADLAAHIAPTMLGQNGVRRYFVAFQNEAEMRGTGGIPGAFGILRADHGQLYFERFESDSYLGIVPTNLEFGTGYDDQFVGARPTSLYVNTNLSPHYPYAAQTWIAMWRKKTGQRLDGAVALDPTALSYLLGVTGPATLPGGEELTSANVVGLTENEIYIRYPSLRPAQQDARKKFLLAVAKASSHKVLDTHRNIVGLLQAAGTAAGQRRLLVYSTDPSVESELGRTALSGQIPQTRSPYVGMSIFNVGGNKLDYYLDRSISWSRTGCGPRRQVTVTIKLTNAAPAAVANYPYLSTRSDNPDYKVRPGDNRVSVSYYATTGARLESASLAGKRTTPMHVNDVGHPIYIVAVELPRGRTQTLVLHLNEPPADGSPVVLKQPGVRPLVTHIVDEACA